MIAQRLVTAAVADELAHERLRQIEGEGWTTGHDDEHDNDELAKAAACYADPFPDYPADPRVNVPARWPRGWDGSWWKPEGHDKNHRGNALNEAGRRRDLVRAGALIIAEIERLDRAGQRR